MVVEQGTVLDSVEYNVQQTAKELVAAEGELKEAQRYQANTGRRKCILFLILIIVGLIIVLIYKPRGGGGDVQVPVTKPDVNLDEALASFTSASASGGGRYRPSIGSYTSGAAVTVSGGRTHPTVSRIRLPLPKPPPLPTRPIAGEGGGW